MDLAIKSLFKIDEKLIKLLRRLVLCLGEEQAALTNLVVDEINYVAVSKSVGRRDWPLDVTADDTANSVNKRVQSRVHL